jgi:hypothetical protein
MIEEHNNACFIVKDATGQALGYFYFENEPGRRSAAKLLRASDEDLSERVDAPPDREKWHSSPPWKRTAPTPALMLCGG